jgi:hypothetical protein
MTLLADAAFWVSIATLVIGAYRYSLSQAYRSKCSNFKMCWGLLDIKRDVIVEQHIDEHAIQQEDGRPDLVVQTRVDE